MKAVCPGVASHLSDHTNHWESDDVFKIPSGRWARSGRQRERKLVLCVMRKGGIIDRSNESHSVCERCFIAF